MDRAAVVRACRVFHVNRNLHFPQARDSSGASGAENVWSVCWAGGGAKNRLYDP
jgi:hypothetical protein